MGAPLEALIESQRPNVALWIPVVYALGIAAYFAVPLEPSGWMLAALAGMLVASIGALFRCGPVMRVLLALAILPGLGFGTAVLRNRAVAAPVLPDEMTANVEGRLVDLSRSGSGRTRVLLDRVVIHGLEPQFTPELVRISLDDSTPTEALVPGARLLGQARISPPGGPAEPGGFDFRRHAWFESLGAIGYARTPMLETEGSDPSGLRQLTFRLRTALSAHIRALIPGQSGAFAAAILSGDRSAMDPAVDDDLRVSNLYHVVSIGGLHMSLIAAAVFAILRYGLALVPWLALHWPLKKIAAVASLAVTFAYLAISGFDVAAQRSFIMLAVVLTAVVLDRPALTMRSVALSALVILAVAPESLMLAGFQMSFAGTIALIAGFEAMRAQAWWQATQTERRWRFARPVLAILMTSLVAGVATAPFSAYHFNTLGQYGVLANMMAMPAMGIVVMPAAVVALFLAPLGLDWLAFKPMGWGIDYVLSVAAFVASLPDGAIGVPAAPPISLGLLSLGGLFLLLWTGRGRWAGLAPMAIAVLIWTEHARPDILISDDGRLFGYMTSAGRVLSSADSGAYAAASWLEDDGDVATQAEAHARASLPRRRHRIEADVPGLGTILYVGASDAATAAADCARAALLIAPNWEGEPAGPCLFVGRGRLRRDGAHAIRITSEGPVVTGALALNRTRPWTRPPVRPREPQPARSGTATVSALTR